jgi:hypothetical protein
LPSSSHLLGLTVHGLPTFSRLSQLLLPLASKFVGPSIEHVSGRDVADGAVDEALDDGTRAGGVGDDLTPAGEGEVGGDDDGPSRFVAAVDEVVEEVGGALGVGEVSELVDAQDVVFCELSEGESGSGGGVTPSSARWSMPSRSVRCIVDDTIAEHSARPQWVRSENAPEFIAALIVRYVARTQIVDTRSRPGKPTDSACIESFHSRFRDELLGRHLCIPIRQTDRRLRPVSPRRSTGYPLRDSHFSKPTYGGYEGFEKVLRFLTANATLRRLSSTPFAGLGFTSVADAQAHIDA